jgi:hypothetical protein
MTIWHPDHCACVLRFDDIAAYVVRACGQHVSEAGNAVGLRNLLVSENQRLNRALRNPTSTLRSRIAALSETEDGETRLRSGVVSWEFVAGVLHITVHVTLTTNQRTQAIAALEAEFGDQVVLHA